jgi:ATP-dependent DNA helicase DinG
VTIDPRDMLSESGPIASTLEGYEPRAEQQRMAEAVADTLGRSGRLLVEAGTGVGKTFAYLVPALQRIIDHQERIVVSTHTISLQEQILEKDIPLLQQVLPEKIRAVLVKGRGNYLSVRRLALASKRQRRLFADNASLESLRLIEDWAYETRDGTLSSLPQLPKPGIWDRVQSDSGNCMGRSCPTYDRCFYQAARRAMERADLLICNHALFFSDLALRARGVSILPPYDHVILDEAHQVEEVASDHFGCQLSEGRVWHLLGALYHARTKRGFLADLQLKDDDGAAVRRVIDLVEMASETADQFFQDLDIWRSRDGGDRGSGRIREPDIVENGLTPVMSELSLALKAARKQAAREADQFELNAYAERAQSIAHDAEALIEQQIDGCVYWMEASGSSRGGRRRMSLTAAPVDVAPILRSQLFERECGIVLTSATLTTSGGSSDDENAGDGFTHFRTRLGCDDADTLQLGSPFDHATQVELFIDRSMATPDAGGYIEALTQRIVHHVDATDGGAFVLFTSYATMQRVRDRLSLVMEAADRPLFVQGDGISRTAMVEQFRLDRRSVLLGTQSFWQGVDVRGEGLRNVIITKLPFDPPDRPLTEARAEQIALEGGNAFMQDQLPRAVIRFKQGFGRLVRSASDTGRVVVLDPRLVTKRYGALFLRALPEGVQRHIVDGVD